VHTSGGYLVQSSYTHFNVFDVKPDTDVYWCTADIGGITGHTYIVYGPLSNGATQVIYEGTPSTPDEHRHFEIIEKYGLTIYYTAPTLIRTFMKWGREIPDVHDLSSRERWVYPPAARVCRRPSKGCCVLSFRQAGKWTSKGMRVNSAHLAHGFFRVLFHTAAVVLW